MSQAQIEIDRLLAEEVARWRAEDQLHQEAHPHWWHQPGWWLLGLLLLGAIGVVGVNLLSLTEDPPLVYPNQPFVVDGPVRAGEPIPLHVTRCNTTGDVTDYSFSRVIHSVDGGMNYPLTDGSAVSLLGCASSLSLGVIAPVQMEPGRYELVGVIHIMGRWRDHKIIYKSQPFEVIH